MAKEFIAVATIDWHSEREETTRTDNILLSEVEDYKDAVARIENMYGNSLEFMQVTLLEGPFIHLSGRYLDMFISGQLEDDD